ncbi:MAG: maleylpyruvate isomerase N-terminal domain-containing protein [Vicinamibacterales bacterium]
MPLQPLTPLDTRALFRPVSTALVALLRGLPAAGWHRPTIAGAWVVRDVVAHLLDTTLRRLSFHRDGMAPPPPDVPIRSERDFVAFLNGLNHQWVVAAKRLSPQVLVDLYSRASSEAADWYEALPLEAPALFPVSWAGEDASAGWFDLGREFTELWHHQQQVRLAVGAPSLGDPRYLRAVIDVAMRGLPHAFRDAPAGPGQTLVVDVQGDAGGQWTLTRQADRWTLAAGAGETATTTVTLTDDVAWRLLFNALPAEDAARAIRVDGREDLARPLLGARSVVV